MYTQILRGLSFTLLAFFTQAQALTLESYLSKVREKNGQIQALEAKAKAFKLSASADSNLITSPRLFASYTNIKDKTAAQIPILSYDQLNQESLQTGIEQTTSVGLKAKASFNTYKTEYLGAAFSSANSLYHDSSPSIELTQSLWKNGFGKQTRALKEQVQSKAEMDMYASLSQKKQLLYQAEMAFYRLALVQEQYKILSEIIDKAKEIYERSKKKSEKNLAELSDVLQAEALYQSKLSELNDLKGELNIAKADFNNWQGLALNATTPNIPLESLEKKLTATMPQSREESIEVKQLRAQAKNERANQKIASENAKPDLDLLATYATSGRADDFPGSNNNAWDRDSSKTTLGLRFSVPLNLGALKDAQNSAKLRHQAADKILSQKVLDEERDFELAQIKVKTAYQTYKYAQKLEKLQKEKLITEDQRFKDGKSTTFQLLSFTQDYLSSMLNRTRSAYNLLNTKTQARLFFE